MRKKIKLVLGITLLSALPISVYAGSLPNKECANLTEQTGEKYYYAEGILTYFGLLPLISHAPKKYEHPWKYLAVFLIAGKDKLELRIQGKWKDLLVLNGFLELAPLATPMEKGKKYSFCYKKEKGKYSGAAFNITDHPETIRPLR